MKPMNIFSRPLMLLFFMGTLLAGACEKETDQTQNPQSETMNPKGGGGGGGGTTPDPCAIRVNFYESIELTQSSPFSMYDFDRIKAVSTFIGFPSGVTAHVYMNNPLSTSYSDWYNLTGVGPSTTKYFTITGRNKPIRLAVWYNDCLYFDRLYN